MNPNGDDAVGGIKSRCKMITFKMFPLLGVIKKKRFGGELK